AIDLADQAYPRQIDINRATQTLLVQNVRESFARTALELIAEGRPLTETVTTTRFMMTPALMELYGFLDVWQVADDGTVDDRFRRANPTLSIYATTASIPMTDTLDPTSLNYMHWTNPDVANAGVNQPAGCGTDPIVYPANAFALHFLLFGALD